MDANPALIQSGGRHRRETPIVLFHDGGGTTAFYCRLGDLHRPVYGISDPHFFTGHSWKSLHQMARIYANLIYTLPLGIEMASTVPRVLLGGWSLGGYLALEVARVLQADGKVFVAGIVMIDSPFPHVDPAPTRPIPLIVANRPFLAPGCPAELRLLVSRSMKRARQLIETWEVPFTAATGFPPVLLLRCEESVPCESPHTIMSVDQWRHDRSLGWERDDQQITGVLDIPGHHFSVAQDAYVDTITAQLNVALKMIDLGLAKPQTTDFNR